MGNRKLVSPENMELWENIIVTLESRDQSVMFYLWSFVESNLGIKPAQLFTCNVFLRLHGKYNYINFSTKFMVKIK